MDDLKEIKEKLASIESLLQRLPEIQAAVFLRMHDEYETAKMQEQQNEWAEKMVTHLQEALEAAFSELSKKL